MGQDFYNNPPPLTDEELLDQWTNEYNAAVANGLWMRARPILRRIEALEERIYRQAAIDREGRPTMNPHPNSDGVWR